MAIRKGNEGNELPLLAVHGLDVRVDVAQLILELRNLLQDLHLPLTNIQQHLLLIRSQIWKKTRKL